MLGFEVWVFDFRIRGSGARGNRIEDSYSRVECEERAHDLVWRLGLRIQRPRVGVQGLRFGFRGLWFMV